MKTINEYVTDLYNKYGSDYKTAKELNVTKMSLSHIRRRGKCSDEAAVKIAELLDIEPEEILIAAAIARSEGKTKDAWKKAAEKLSNIHYAKLKLLALGGLTKLYAFFGVKSNEARQETEKQFLPCPDKSGIERRKSLRDTWSYPGCY